MRRILLSCVLLLALALGCRGKETSQASTTNDTAGTPAPEPIPETGSTDPATRTYAFDQRQDFAATMRQQLATIDQQINDLAAQAKSKGGSVSDRALADIRASRRAVTRNLQRVEAATAANWDQIERGVKDAMDHLQEGIEAAQPK